MEMDESESSPSSSVSSLSERHPPPQSAAKNTATKPKQKIKEAGIIDEDEDAGGKEVPTSIKIPKQRHMTSSSSSTTTTSRVLDFSPRQFSLLNLPNNRDSDQDYTPESIQDGDSLLDASSSSEEDDGEDIVVDTIIACRKDTIQNWYNRCSKINTSEVMNGSLFYDPSSMSHSSSRLQDSNVEERFLVKWAEMSYIHCSWETEKVLVEQTANGTYQLNSFFKRFVESGYRFDIAERRGGEFFDHDLVQIDRILEVQAGDGDAPVVLDKESDEYEDGNGQQLMVKWCNLPYSESTYEYERDLILMGVEYESHYEVHLKRQKKPSSREGKNNLAKHDRLVHHLRRLFRVSKDTVENVGMNAYVKELQAQEFRNGGKLRDYQAEGVAWMVANYVNGRSSILADEMGLGKTIQTAAFLRTLNDNFGNRGPFLIIAPLSTVVQWYREITKWTHLNVILYSGNAADRAVIREYEFAFPTDRPTKLRGKQKYLKNCHKEMTVSSDKVWMIQIVITTPEALLAKDQDELTSVDWEMLIVDEAHNRLKNRTSKFSMSLREERFLFRHCVLLTGTPIQNNMDELWTLLNVIDPNAFVDRDYFLGRFGNMRGKERVDELHEIIRPYMLRRLKEDVEKNLPAKEETIIEVDLTSFQKKYYRALYEKNRRFLMEHKGGISSQNIVMELRKCCNHPFLLDGVEKKAEQGMNNTTVQDEIDFLVKSSGKLVLLDKLLPKLKAGGHRLLIFSQFKIMLNIIEDYLILKEFLYERIDGAITGKKRQTAIDRFQNDTSIFVMLLTTKAGGVGINLTAADTCIIFDSDWNPQNDLQAQARCHRIGQTKPVKIYRFLTKKTYEMRLFHLGSMKMGLDKAVLQGVENKGEDVLTAEEAERLLRYGAYEVLADDGDEGESNNFMEEDIDTILLSRAKTRVHQANFTNDFTFKKASFKASEGDLLEGSKECNVDVDDPDFWTKIFASSNVKDDEAISSSPVYGHDKDGFGENSVVGESTIRGNNDSNNESGIVAQIVPIQSPKSRKRQTTIALDRQPANVTQNSTAKLSEEKEVNPSLITKKIDAPKHIAKIEHKAVPVLNGKRNTARSTFPVKRDSSNNADRQIESAKIDLQTPKKSQKKKLNPNVARAVARRSPRIKKQEKKDQCSIASALELKVAIATGVSMVMKNRRGKRETKVEIKETYSVSNRHGKDSPLKPKIIDIESPSNITMGRPRKRPLDKGMEPTISASPQKFRSRKVLKEDCISIVQRKQRLRYNNTNDHDISETDKMTQRKIKKPQYYEPLEMIQRNSSKSKDIQSKRESSARQSFDLKVALGGSNSNSKIQHIKLVEDSSVKANVGKIRSKKSQLTPKQTESSRRRSEGNQNPCSWALMGSSTSFEQSIEKAPKSHPASREKRTKRQSHGSILENMFSTKT